MPTFKYKKLVRNNIPGWHVARNHEMDSRQLTGEDLKAALVAKLHEEADEVPVRAAIDDEIIEEIGDVQQVLDNLKAVYGISDEAVDKVMRKKRERSGDFLDGHYVESVYMPDENDKWAIYCRERPEKYPEVME